MVKTAVRLLLTGLFVGSGVLHFADPKPFVAIVPPSLPRPDALVALSGACEIAGGVGLLVPALRRPAGFGLVALLLAVFPANIYMAAADVPAGGVRFPWWAHALRLPFQFVLIAAVAWTAGLLRRR